MRNKLTLLKKSTIVGGLVMMVLLIISGCNVNNDPDPTSYEIVRSHKNRNTSPTYSNSEMGELVSGNNAFAFQLYHEIKEDGKNLFYSPYSISLAMAMAYGGARNNTEVQMGETLNFTLSQAGLHPTFNGLDLVLNSRGANGGDADKVFKLKITNAIWGQKHYSFLDTYLDLLAENYDAGMRILDFMTDPEGSREAINNWVLEQTENKIKELLPPGSIVTSTRLVLTNAIYFNASWAIPFNEELTEDADFHLLDGSRVTVPMMTLSGGGSETGEVMSFANGDGYRAVELPYYGDELSMLLIVPDQGRFAQFEEAMDAQVVAGIVANLQEGTVPLKMPKFQSECDFSLVDVLSRMGMPDAFDGSRADFTGIDGGYGGLFISKVLHKAFISVDEAGTEAAAATAVVFLEGAMPDDDLIVDRPFIYIIRDKGTNTILFAGRIMNPRG